MSEPHLDLTKQRKRRRLGPGGEWLERKDQLMPSPAYDPRGLEQVLGESKQVVLAKAKERFRSMNPKGTLPRGFPENRFQFERAVKANDQDALRYLVRYVLLEATTQPTSAFTLLKGDSIEITFDFAQGGRRGAHDAGVLLSIKEDAKVAAIDVMGALSNPGSKEWNMLVIHTPIDLT